MNFTHPYSSPLGGITLVSDGISLIGLLFDGQKYFPRTLGQEHKEASLPVFEKACLWLDLYFSGEEPGFTPPLAIKSTEFRRSVWEILRSIPYGGTMTYGEIASKIAQQRNIPRMSAQAVGGAVGHNPIALIIPCHRVIGAGGNLTGYAGGLEKKRKLLELEKAAIQHSRYVMQGISQTPSPVSCTPKFPHHPAHFQWPARR